jgi:DNA-binding response OmpR family regulator
MVADVQFGSVSAAAATTLRRPRQLRVVVIDDEPDTVITLLAILRDEGYEAEGFSNAKEALRSIPNFLPDVIISDLAMPSPSGWDVARNVRALLGEKPMLIAVSAHYTKDTDKRLAEIVGYNYYLTKPCDPNVLLTLVQKAKR